MIFLFYFSFSLCLCLERVFKPVLRCRSAHSWPATVFLFVAQPSPKQSVRVQQVQGGYVSYGREAREKIWHPCWLNEDLENTESFGFKKDESRGSAELCGSVELKACDHMSKCVRPLLLTSWSPVAASHLKIKTEGITGCLSLVSFVSQHAWKLIHQHKAVVVCVHHLCSQRLMNYSASWMSE